MTALLPREDDFKGDLPIFIDYTRKDALPREQAFTPDDIQHALHWPCSRSFLSPSPGLLASSMSGLTGLISHFAGAVLAKALRLRPISSHSSCRLSALAPW